MVAREPKSHGKKGLKLFRHSSLHIYFLKAIFGFFNIKWEGLLLIMIREIKKLVFTPAFLNCQIFKGSKSIYMFCAHISLKTPIVYLKKH